MSDTDKFMIAIQIIAAIIAFAALLTDWLIPYFSDQKELKRKGLEILSGVIRSLEPLCFYVKNNSQTRLEKSIITDARDNLGKLTDLVEEIDSEKAKILQSARETLHEIATAGIPQYPAKVCEALRILEPDWRRKHPENFKELHEIREILKK